MMKWSQIEQSIGWSFLQSTASALFYLFWIYITFFISRHSNFYLCVFPFKNTKLTIVDFSENLCWIEKKKITMLCSLRKRY